MTTPRPSTAGQDFPVARQNDAAPRTCELMRQLLPFENRLIHARWSREACWVPLGETNWSLPVENANSFPAPGEILLYPGGRSEAELLIAYGPTRFSSKAGQLSGNPVLVVLHGNDRLAEIGGQVLWGGAVDLCITEGNPLSASHLADAKQPDQRTSDK